MPEESNPKPLILVVDDHEAQRRLFELLADRLSITAHVVQSGEEALEAVETYRFDIILMDVVMPKMDGLECTQKIREWEKKSGGHVPIIAVTACVLPGDEERCLAAGMDDYLAKPFTLEQLKEKIAKWAS